MKINIEPHLAGYDEMVKIWSEATDPLVASTPKAHARNSLTEKYRYELMQTCRDIPPGYTGFTWDESDPIFFLDGNKVDFWVNSVYPYKGEPHKISPFRIGGPFKTRTENAMWFIYNNAIMYNWKRLPGLLGYDLKEFIKRACDGYLVKNNIIEIEE